MNRANSQEITKRGGGEVADSSPLRDNCDIKLGQCPPSNIGNFNNNKQQFYQHNSKNIPSWYNRTAPG